MDYTVSSASDVRDVFSNNTNFTVYTDETSDNWVINRGTITPVASTITWNIESASQQEELRQVKELVQVMIEEQIKTQKKLDIVLEGISKILPKNYQKELRD